MQIKALQEPDHDRCTKNNGKCSLQEVLCFFPEKLTNIFRSRHTIIRKLHNKRNRFSFKHRPFHCKCSKDSHQDSEEIETNHYNCTLPREKRRCKECIDRKFCWTTHKRSQHNRHFTITLWRKCPARHNSRYCTSKSDQHRYNTSSGKTNLSQKFIHNKRNPCHISTVLQHRKEKEQCNNDRQETQHASNPLKDSIYNQWL